MNKIVFLLLIHVNLILILDNFKIKLAIILSVYFSAFGDDDIREVLDHYQQVLQTSGVDTALAEAEWTALKFTLYDEM